jgi:CHAT domain-containing protein
MSRPVAVPLGPATSLDATVMAWRTLIEEPSAGTAAGPADAELRYRRTGERLRQRVWDPLADLLRGAEHVFIVPDGTLNLVSFAALPADGQHYLLENGPILHLLSTERDLVPADTTSTRGRGLLAVGGPAYDVVAARAAPGVTLRAGCDGGGGLHFADLPSARAEVTDIARMWSTISGATGSAPQASPDLAVLSGSSAGKAPVTRAMSGRRVIHLATHGFFLGGPCTAAGARTRGVGGLVGGARTTPIEDNPLLRSGLAFAGANNRGADRSAADGILTAEEVAALNLQGTEWAVLSACDTGLGEVRAGEGVFGLRRAFQIAGVRTVIMSLWSVEDEATRVWMRTLYEARFGRRMHTADALHTASLEVLRDRRARHLSTHPFFWAAFVAVGDWQ